MTRGQLGRRAELAVADFLFASGFTILGRNLRFGALELDVVARRGPLVVVVEVRTRGAGAYRGAFESVTRAKRMHLLRAARRLWHQTLSTVTGIERLRIDVAAVTFDGPTTRVEYAEGAVS